MSSYHILRKICIFPNCNKYALFCVMILRWYVLDANSSVLGGFTDFMVIIFSVLWYDLLIAYTIQNI